MKQQRKVIHIELNEPKDGKRHFYFGSVTAIYDTLIKDDIGISKESLWNTLKDGEYKNRKATIRKGVILSKQTDRGQTIKTKNYDRSNNR